MVHGQRAPTCRCGFAAYLALTLVQVSFALAEEPTRAERLRAGRDRLTELAKQESLAHPGDADVLLRWMFLRGDMEVPEGTDLPDGAALAQVACESAFDDLARGASLDDVEALAEERMAVLERQLPGSSLIPLYRLRLLVLTCRRRPDFYLAATRQIEEALKRDNFESPTVQWMVTCDEWLERNESDPFVRAMLPPAIVARPYLASRHLGKILVGASMAPGTPDPHLFALAAALHRLLVHRAKFTIDNLEFIVAHVVWGHIIEAEALLA